MMVRPLMDILSEIPDFRKAKGKRHPLSAILGMACAATLCGYKSYSAMAEWGRNYGGKLVQALGFTHEKTPCASTLHTVFRNIDKKAVEAKLGSWAESVMSATPDAEVPEDDLEGVSLDGKTLGGSRKQGAPGTHLLSAVSHKLGVTLTQQAGDHSTDEMRIIHEALQNLVLEGRVFTMDALNTQRKTAETITEGGGDYVMIAKKNQASLLNDVKTVFDGPYSHLLQKSSVQTLDMGHGRIEDRHLTASDELSDYSDWPGLEQVFQLTRRTTIKKTEKVREETVYGITSLTPQQADSARLLELVRCHWHIENMSHWVRDVTFDEDRSQVRCGNIPQVMAAIRNTVIGLMRWLGYTNIVATCRYFAAQPWDALEAIGIQI
jgi:predicted transposase YbfD/YdcC